MVTKHHYSELMGKLTYQAGKLKLGSVVVTVTKTLRPSSNFELVSSRQYRMPWGLATVHVHVRTR